MQEKPEILDRRTLTDTGIFHIQELDLAFSNGQERKYQRIVGGPRGAVLVVPMLDDDTLLLIREFAAGTERYELGFPKGGIERDESPQQAADREIREEIGYGSDKVTLLRKVNLAPGYIQHHTYLMLARGLFEAKLPGDEPEPIQVVPWKISQAEELLQMEEFTETRSVLALMLCLQRLKAEK